jgi:hypothetical protein
MGLPWGSAPSAIDDIDTAPATSSARTLLARFNVRA